MYKIKVFFVTLWRFIKFKPALAIVLASLTGVLAAAAVTLVTVNRLKSKDVMAKAESITSSYNSEINEPEEVQSEPDVPPPVEQPVEKQVTYKGKQINVVKAEVAKVNSKEDAENGNYKKEQQQSKPQTTEVTENPYDKAPATIPYKKSSGGYVCGIDVSSHNKEINWAKVKAAGVEFAMIRCGYRGYLTGKIVTDATFNYNIENAYKNGIDVGIYFYSTATNEQEALEEAAYVTERIKEAEEKGVTLKYPVAYDFEEFYNNDERTRAKNLTAGQISKNTSAFLDYIKSQGYKPMLYAGKNPIKKYWTAGMASKYDFWLAHYTEATEYTGKFFMWQFTSSGTVDGIPGSVDLNICGFEGNDNNPKFLIPAGEAVKAYAKPNAKSSVLLTLQPDTVYLCRNTYDYEYKEIKASGKYYYVLASELTKIPFEKSEDKYKTATDTELFSKPFDDTYKTDMIIEADTPVTLTGLWQDKWAEIEYNEKTYYVKADNLIKVLEEDENNIPSDQIEDTSAEQ